MPNSDELIRKAAKAFTRREGLPVNITRYGYENLPPKIEGTYDYNSDPYIGLDLYGNPNPGQQMDALKHELVHHYMRFAIPQPKDYDNFEYTYPTAKDIPTAIKEWFSGFPTKSNLWKFRDWNRGGNVYQELPAYMSVYNPDEAKEVTQRQRDQYMQDLFKLLKSRGKQGVIDKITNLLKGREAYVNSGLFPR